MLKRVPMLRIISLLYSAIFWGLLKASGLDLPPYISSCSLSDPKLCQCLRDKANQAIPVITKGDVFFNIPPLVPICYAEAPFHATDLLYLLYNSRCNDFNRFAVSNIFVDLKNRNFGFEGGIDNIELTAENYTIAEGEMIGIRASGHGKINITFLDYKLKYAARIRFYKKGGDVYLNYFDSRADVSVERIYFYFQNLKSADVCDVNAYLNDNWEEFFTQVKPALDDYATAFANFMLEPIANAVPFNKIFLPYFEKILLLLAPYHVQNV